MGNFTDLVAAMDDALINTFTKATDVLRVYAADGSATFDVPTIERNPTLEDDYIPGSTPGSTSLILFIRHDAIDNLSKGLRAEYGGVDYDVMDVSVDPEGGAKLKLRKRS